MYATTLRVTLLAPDLSDTDPNGDASWNEAIDRLRTALGAPRNPTLLPPHFLKSAFRRIGGHIFTVIPAQDESQKTDWAIALVGAVFALPRSLGPDHQHIYTLRLHQAPGQAGQKAGWDAQQVAEQVSALLAPAKTVLYDPKTAYDFMPTHLLQNGLDYGHPEADEVEQVRRLQQRLWTVSDDFLYPADIHSRQAAPGTSLVARDGFSGQVVGTLLGFFKWGASPLPQAWAGQYQESLRIESQSLAVEPAYRGQGIAFNLKRIQAQQAQAVGIDLIEWTTDPLLFANAVLNFGKLRAICTQFMPDLIPFRNLLNQLPTSRLRMTLLIPSQRVQEALDDPGSNTPLCAIHRNYHLPVRVNDGWSNPLFGVDSPSIAVEVPSDWAALQRTDLAIATRWRATTDRLFSHYIGSQPSQYIITTAAQDGDRRFLIGQRVDGALLARLGA